jgi:hypothetical protein
MKQIVLAFGVLAALPVAAQQRPPAPDPRLEMALSTTVISSMERSVAFDKTLPPPATRPRPAVNEPDMAKVDDAIYVERRLLPQRAELDDPEVVRVQRRDR